jgi:hypothetical protein
VLLSVGLALQAGATGAVKAIKMSAKLVAGNPPAGASGLGAATTPAPVTAPVANVEASPGT